MTHPGAGFGQVTTTMRWTRDYFNGRPKLKRRDPFPITPLPAPAMHSEAHSE